MKHIFSIFIMLLIAITLKAQTAYIGYGTVLTHTKQTTALIESKNPLLNTGGFVSLGYIHHQKKWDYIMATSIYRGVTSFWRSENTFDGYPGSNVYRFDLGISYNLINPSYWLYIKPYVALGLQFTYKRPGQIGDFFPVYGPYYYQTNPPSSDGHSSFQFVPTGGIKIGVRVLKYLDICFNAQGVYGFQSFQKVNFDYTFYKDNPPIKRRAVFESTGTGIFKSINLGIKFDAFRKKSNNDCEKL